MFTNLLSRANLRLWPLLLILWSVGLLACGTDPRLDVSASTQASTDTVRVGAFNMLRLGHGDSKDFSRVAELITKADVDIMAGVEVMKPEAASQLLAELNAEGDRRWGMEVTGEATGESSYKEHFAFFYDQDRVRPATAAEDNYCDTEDTKWRASFSCTLEDRGSEENPEYERDPMLAHFYFGDQKLSLLNVHVVFGEASRAGYARRQDELKAVMAAMERIRAHSPEDEVIALGDFNLERDTDREDPEGKYIPKWLDGAQVTVGGDTTLGRSNYDHTIHLGDNAGQVDQYEVVLDFDPTNDRHKEAYKTEVSDHFPIAVEIEF